MNIILIFLGAGIGGVLRYLVSTWGHFWLPKTFPFGTLLVNVTGCFLMGFLAAVILQRFKGDAGLLSSFLLIGLLGGYTTFSAFALETVKLMEGGQVLIGLGNIIVSVVMCTGGLWLGQQLNSIT